MNSDLLKRIDTTKLYPPFLASLTALLVDAFQLGVSFWCVSGYRSFEEQTVLYNQGRTTSGQIVTAADAGQSSHNYGLAADVCRDEFIDRAGLQPDYMPDHYEALRTLAPKYNLVWGGTWAKKDRPHLQWPGYVTAKELEPLKTQYELGGLVSVFTFIDKGAINDEPTV